MFADIDVGEESYVKRHLFARRDLIHSFAYNYVSVESTTTVTIWIAKSYWGICCVVQLNGHFMTYIRVWKIIQVTLCFLMCGLLSLGCTRRRRHLIYRNGFRCMICRTRVPHVTRFVNRHHWEKDKWLNVLSGLLTTMVRSATQGYIDQIVLNNNSLWNTENRICNL